MRGCQCRGGPTLCDQCQALAERAGVAVAPPTRLVGGLLTPAQAQQISEKVFMAAVVRLAREHGWLCYHTHNARKSLPGYPDLTMAKAGRPLLFAELKVPGGQLTLQQHAWLEALTLAEGKEVHLWQPDDWPTIAARLTR